MYCKFCGYEKTIVKRTKENVEGVVVRRRECSCCRHRFTTKEHYTNNSPAPDKNIEIKVDEISKLTPKK